MKHQNLSSSLKEPIEIMLDVMELLELASKEIVNAYEQIADVLKNPENDGNEQIPHSMYKRMHKRIRSVLNVAEYSMKHSARELTEAQCELTLGLKFN